MAYTDINFQEGEGQDFVLNLPVVVHSGVLFDELTESSSSQFPDLETTLVASGGNIFIMSE